MKKNNKYTEEVLVFDADKMNKFNGLPGFSTDRKNIKYFTKTIAPIYSKYISREEAEVNPQYKQIIPYILVSTYDGNVMTYKRTKRGGEGRLHEKHSIGIGGHVNPVDGIGLDAISNAVIRELSEETSISNNIQDHNIQVEVLGILYDSSNDVGKVHFGLVFQIILDNTEELPTPKDPAVAEFNWVSVEELKENPPENLENWSQIILNAL